MKKIISIVFMLAFAFTMTMARADGFPEVGKYTIGDHPIGKETFVIKTEIPLIQRIENPKWQLSVSWAWYDGQKWILVPLDNYAVKTESKEIVLIGQIPVPGGINMYWLRIWGQELESEEWLSPDQNSIFARKNIKGHFAYEFLVDTKTGEKKVVPSDYQKRP